MEKETIMSCCSWGFSTVPLKRLSGKHKRRSQLLFWSVFLFWAKPAPERGRQRRKAERLPFLHNPEGLHKVMLKSQLLWYLNAFPWTPMSKCVFMLPWCLWVNPVEAQPVSTPRWGLMTSFQSQILLFTYVTLLTTCISSNKQMAFPPQQDFPVLPHISSDPSVTHTEVTSHVAVFPPKRLFHYFFLWWSHEDAWHFIFWSWSPI